MKRASMIKHDKEKFEVYMNGMLWSTVTFSENLLIEIWNSVSHQYDTILEVTMTEADLGETVYKDRHLFILMDYLSELSEGEILDMVSGASERKLKLYYCELENTYAMILR